MLKVHTLTPSESFGSNMYVLESQNEYAVIDPSVSFSDAVKSYPCLKHATKYVILTHAHFDHFLEIDSWKENTDAVILVGLYDEPALKDPYKNAYQIFFGLQKGYYGPTATLEDGETLVLGDESFKILATPGHTPGGLSLLFSGCIFVGDTVFANGGYGRYDLPGGDFPTLAHSIKRICNLDQNLTVYSGHGRPTDVKEIRLYFSQL